MASDPSAAALDLSRIPRGARTRFAPAPTGYLHRGHLVNAVLVWAIARAVGGRVVLRIEDHDRGRSRPEYERALLDDLERLGLDPDEPSLRELRDGRSEHRQSDVPGRYAAALDRLGALARIYRCACSRATFAAWARDHGSPWTGEGCPGGCARRAVPPGVPAGLRVAAGPGIETWDDLLAGPRSGSPTAGGDPLLRERSGGWTYAWCVVVDDLHQGIDLVIRGADLLDATPVQLRLARLLAGGHPARFLHHALVRRPDGTKLSKADRATAVRDLLDAGECPGRLLADAARAAGFAAIPDAIDLGHLAAIVAAAPAGRPGDTIPPAGGAAP
jgi:glutamyl/glutaminyl-tRNA synthetase